MKCLCVEGRDERMLCNPTFTAILQVGSQRFWVLAEFGINNYLMIQNFLDLTCNTAPKLNSVGTQNFPYLTCSTALSGVVFVNVATASDLLLSSFFALSSNAAQHDGCGGEIKWLGGWCEIIIVPSKWLPWCCLGLLCIIRVRSPVRTHSSNSYS